MYTEPTCKIDNSDYQNLKKRIDVLLKKAVILGISVYRQNYYSEKAFEIIKTLSPFVNYLNIDGTFSIHIIFDLKNDKVFEKLAELLLDLWISYESPFFYFIAVPFENLNMNLFLDSMYPWDGFLRFHPGYIIYHSPIEDGIMWIGKSDNIGNVSD